MDAATGPLGQVQPMRQWMTREQTGVFEYFIRVVSKSVKEMTNELRCKKCNRWSSDGCHCNQKKEICRLCNREFDDLDTLQKHVSSWHM